jgi:DNA-binding transcriptional MerR regulator
MTGQQLDLFGAPLRPPKKILVDEPPVEEQPAPAEASEPVKAATPIQENVAEDIQPIEDFTDVATDAINEIPAIDEVVEDDVSTTIEDPLIPDESSEDDLPVAETEETVVTGENSEDELPDEENIEAETDAPVGIEVEVSTSSIAVIAPERKSKSENGEQQHVVYRGRKTGDPEEEMEMLNVPPDEELFKRQYYSMREAAAMFNVNQALLRFWENEFDILNPKKNKKGDRYFRPIDIKNLVLIYHLLRVRKFTLEGAKAYLQTHQKAADSFQLVQRLEKLKSFLLELKANL